MSCTRSSPTDVSQFRLPSSTSPSAKRKRDHKCLSPFKRPRWSSLVSSEAVDMLVSLKKREEESYVYSSKYRPPVDASWRSDICQWIYKVVESNTWSKLGTSVFTWEVAAVTMSYFDRFLAKVAWPKSVPSEQRVLLASLASLRIASKLYSNAIIGMDFFLYIGRGRFSASDIEEMEKEMLSELSWRMHPPTSVDFVAHLLALLPGTIQKELQRRSIRPLKKDAICDPFFVQIPNSIVAFASILNAAEDTNAIISSEFSGHFLPLVASMYPSLSPNDLQVQQCMCRLREIEMDSVTSRWAAASGFMRPIS